MSSRESNNAFPPSGPLSVERYSCALHEVSNALTVVLGWLEMARQAESLEEAHKALLVAQEHARRGRTMARRSIGAEAESSYESRSASAIAKFAATSVGPQAAGRDVEVIVELGEATDVRVENDGQVLQVLTNLLLNAIDFSPLRARVTLTVERANARLLFRVQDEGPGVDVETAEELFTTLKSTRPGGAGIGLPLSRSLALENGGELRLAHPPVAKERGACFELQWPAAPSAAVPPGKNQSAVLSGARLLVIEDDVSIASLIELSFEAQGAHVLSITEPDQLDEVLMKDPVFDVVLLDLSPVKGRLEEIFARLRALSPHAPVILMSGEPTGVPQVEGANFAAWVRKPFDMGQLLDTVAGLLQG